MIPTRVVCVSTSSPLTSVALWRDGECAWSHREEARQNASQKALESIQNGLSSIGLSLADLEGIVVDRGPGSFTGTKVGVVIAKVLASELNIPVAGVLSFDLMGPEGPWAIPVRRGVYCRRDAPGSEWRLVAADELGAARGYGPDFPEPTYPDAAKWDPNRDHPRWATWAELQAEYVLPPSITPPKKPYREMA
ncbi:MAG TPA: tRNA (adenosine(37)-N6)-threonylcarbamoyltransferase complex dimerization subunit type 1 TsaB [Fimbriimonadaceae bacterium]|nr:tRNA (adenosine(37)-N6)-threonylcarbamoyltransferase complex dimerization subunit type 1 TsaB [Fimbriimonadaceae bacterium]HRJ32051.1 tRNA (adenosine(37)-N6)-threonylcarbamoyltransferase complex dimerization subunit type 1 TsaB [Fimbriimonadaceae bacterium]